MNEIIHLLTSDEQAELLEIIEQTGLSARNWFAPLRRKPEAARLLIRYYRLGVMPSGAQQVVTACGPAPSAPPGIDEQ